MRSHSAQGQRHTTSMQQIAVLESKMTMISNEKEGAKLGLFS